MSKTRLEIKACRRDMIGGGLNACLRDVVESGRNAWLRDMVESGRSACLRDMIESRLRARHRDTTESGLNTRRRDRADSGLRARRRDRTDSGLTARHRDTTESGLTARRRHTTESGLHAWLTAGILLGLLAVPALAQPVQVHVAVSSPLAGRQIVGGTCVDWEVSAWVDRLGNQGLAVISVDLRQSSTTPGATVDLVPGRRALVLRPLARPAAGFFDFREFDRPMGVGHPGPDGPPTDRGRGPARWTHRPRPLAGRGCADQPGRLIPNAPRMLVTSWTTQPM